MKKQNTLILLSLMLCLLLCGCSRKEKQSEELKEDDTGPRITEVTITGANFYDYFDYKEYPSYATDEDGNINACNLSYGFSLRDGYIAANVPEHRDSLSVSFTADGHSRYGEFSVDFQNLSYSGSVWSEEHETVSETLSFWPQGNRTVSYPYGTLSSSYIITLENFTVTAVSGSIWLLIGG